MSFHQITSNIIVLRFTRINIYSDQGPSSSLSAQLALAPPPRWPGASSLVPAGPSDPDAGAAHALAEDAGKPGNRWWGRGQIQLGVKFEIPASSQAHVLAEQNTSHWNKWEKTLNNHRSDPKDGGHLPKRKPVSGWLQKRRWFLSFLDIVVHADVCPTLNSSGLVLFGYLIIWKWGEIDSWDWLLIGWVHVSEGPNAAPSPKYKKDRKKERTGRA